MAKPRVEAEYRVGGNFPLEATKSTGPQVPRLRGSAWCGGLKPCSACDGKDRIASNCLLKTHTPMPIRWCLFKTAGKRQFERTLQELGLLAKFCPTLGRDHFTYVCIGRESSYCSEGCLEATFASCLREFEEPYLRCSA